MIDPRFSRRAMLGTSIAAGLAASFPLSAARRTPMFKRIGKPLGVQLYALGDAPEKDLRGTLTRLAAMGYSDFELPGFYGKSAKELRADADAAGVRFGSFHIGLPNRTPPGSLHLMSSAQQLADAFNTLGLFKVVLPIPPLPDDFSFSGGGDIRAALSNAVLSGGIDGWKRMAAMLNERAAALKPYGIQLGYHNHNMEFAPVGGTTGWQVLTDELDPGLVFFELDLGWAAAAGRDPATELAKLKGRVKMVHVKDIMATTKPNFALLQDPAEVGRGALNWNRILPAAVAAGVEHYYVEQEPPFTLDRFDSMKISHDFLARFAG